MSTLPAPADHRNELIASEQPIAQHAVAPVVCPSCEATIADRYCPRCGERRVEPGDFALRGVAGELLEHVASWDSRLVRTLWFVLTRPGFLTAEYVRGARTRYLRPIQLFVLVSVVVFLVAPRIGLFTFDAKIFFEGSLIGVPLRPRAAALMAARHQDAAAFYRWANASIEDAKRPVISLLVPFLAVALAVLNRRARRSAVEHLAFGVHAITFILLYASLVLPPSAFFLRLATAHASRTQATGILLVGIGVLSTVLAAGIGTYLAGALRRVYATSRGMSFVHAAALLAWLFVGVSLFQLVVFATVLATT